MSEREPDNLGKWRRETEFWRPFSCACGYQGKEFWRFQRPNVFICTKCGNGRPAPTPAEQGESDG